MILNFCNDIGIKPRNKVYTFKPMYILALSISILQRGLFWRDLGRPAPPPCKDKTKIA